MPKLTELYNWVCTVHSPQWYRNRVEKLRYWFKMILCIIYCWSTYVSLWVLFFLYLKTIKCYFSTDSKHYIYHSTLSLLYLQPTAERGLCPGLCHEEKNHIQIPAHHFASCSALGNLLNFSETLTCPLTGLSCQVCRALREPARASAPALGTCPRCPAQPSCHSMELHIRVFPLILKMAHSSLVSSSCIKCEQNWKGCPKTQKSKLIMVSKIQINMKTAMNKIAKI